MCSFWLLGSNDRSVIVWNVGGNLNLESELVKPCSALSHHGNNNTAVSGWKFCLYRLQVVMWYSSRFCDWVVPVHLSQRKLRYWKLC